MHSEQCKQYIFRRIEKAEIPQLFQLIVERMKWMDANGIRQWNATNYIAVYPKSYYEEKESNGEVFVLANAETNEIVCGAVLKQQDERWHDDGSAIYLHNFVSKVGEHGAGTLFLQKAEQYATEMGKDYFRLDSSESNIALANYYETQGFLPVGKCEDGLYKGVLRQKKLYNL